MLKSVLRQDEFLQSFSAKIIPSIPPPCGFSPPLNIYLHAFDFKPSWIHHIFIVLKSLLLRVVEKLKDLCRNRSDLDSVFGLQQVLFLFCEEVILATTAVCSEYRTREESVYLFLSLLTDCKSLCVWKLCTLQVKDLYFFSFIPVSYVLINFEDKDSFMTQMRSWSSRPLCFVRTSVALSPSWMLQQSNPD